MKIFLSYASENRARAEEIALALEAGGHDVFYDRQDLAGGDDYNTVIRERIAEADLRSLAGGPGDLELSAAGNGGVRPGRRPGFPPEAAGGETDGWNRLGGLHAARADMRPVTSRGPRIADHSPNQRGSQLLPDLLAP